MNPRSQVGDVMGAADGRHAAGTPEPAVLHPSEDSTIARDVNRGAWRRARVHRTPVELVGLVLWWVVVGAFAAACVIFIIRQP